MFGNVYDARQSDLESNRKAAVDAASLGGYRTMAAVAGEAGGMLGQGLSSLAGALPPEQAKQVKIQELMGQYPNPTTYKEYMDIAGKLSSSGYFEEAKHFNELAKNASITETTSAKANKPSAADISEAGNLMFNQLDTPVMQEQFMRIMYPNKTEDEIKILRDEKGFKAGMNARLKNATDSFSKYVGNKYKDKDSLNTLLSDSKSLMIEFKAYSAERGNEYIQSLAGLLKTEAPSSGFSVTTDPAGDSDGGTTTSVGVDTWLANKYPNASQFELDTKRNNFTASIDNIGVMLDPDAGSAYAETDRLPGIDATFGNISDFSVSAANTITRGWGNIANYFSGDGAEADKKRTQFKEASDWFTSSAGGHRYFSLHPEKFAKASASPEAALKFYKSLSADDKGSQDGVLNAIGL